MTDALTIRQQAYHQSTLKELLDGCSWKWKLRYLDGLDDPSGWDALVGTSVHHAIEQHEQERIAARRERRQPSLPEQGEMVAVAGSWLRANDIGRQHDYGDGRPVDVDTAVAAAEVALGHWWHGVIPDGQPGAGGTLRDRAMRWQPVAVEPHFRVWRPGISRPLGGWIDGVYLLPDGSFRLVDLKTAWTFGRWPTDGTVSRLQPAQYALGALASTTLPVWGQLPSFEFHVMRTKAGSNSRFEGVRVIPVELDMLDVAWLEDRAAQADRIVQTGAFQPDPERAGPLCSKRWCSFWGAKGSPCPARPEGYGEAPTQPDDPFDGLDGGGPWPF